MKPIAVCLIALAACQGMGPETEPEAGAPNAGGTPADPETPTAAPVEPLPDQFVVIGVATVEEAYLAPREAWRQLRSRLTKLQADARRWDRDLLVSFESGAVHWTRRDGARTTWKMPEALVLNVVTPHVVVRKDLTLVGFLGDGTQIPGQEELTVATVTWTGVGGGKPESGLVVKGGKAFRSMTPR